MLPFSVLPLNYLGFTLENSTFLKLNAWSENSYLKCFQSNVLSACNWFSSRTGLTNVQQSLSGKNVLNNLLILFFSSTPSENPGYSFNDLSKYWFGVS